MAAMYVCPSLVTTLKNCSSKGIQKKMAKHMIMVASINTYAKRLVVSIRYSFISIRKFKLTTKTQNTVMAFIIVYVMTRRIKALYNISS